MCVIIYLHKLSAPAPLPPGTLQLTWHSVFCTSHIKQSLCACAAKALGLMYMSFVNLYIFLGEIRSLEQCV
jgi:hypothetical protein